MQPAHDPIADAAQQLELDQPVPEPARAGEAGAVPCYYCDPPAAKVVWENAHWQVVPRDWSPVIGGVLLISREHIDSISDLPSERQAEFGLLAAVIETAIMSLGEAKLIHMYRWGDGCAHFHVHFVGRPVGRLQFRYRYLPFLERRLPDPGADRLSAACTVVAKHLSEAGIG